jgi:hypothetical protein
MDVALPCAMVHSLDREPLRWDSPHDFAGHEHCPPGTFTATAKRLPPGLLFTPVAIGYHRAAVLATRRRRGRSRLGVVVEHAVPVLGGCAAHDAAQAQVRAAREEDRRNPEITWRERAAVGLSRAWTQHCDTCGMDHHWSAYDHGPDSDDLPVVVRMVRQVVSAHSIDCRWEGLGAFLAAAEAEADPASAVSDTELRRLTEGGTGD